MNPDLAVGEELFNESQLHIMFHPFTLNIVWGKLGGGGAPAFWLIEPLVVDLAPIDCIA
jgi:hypothetical protein